MILSCCGAAISQKKTSGKPSEKRKKRRFRNVRSSSKRV